jgi:prepilin-type N-terminal cleavage/methylation domain-containing protein
MRKATIRRSQRGFSLLEMLVTLTILTVVLGVVFMHLGDAQKKSRSQESRIDLTQQARSFMDEIARDLHQTGYPTLNMFDGSLGLTTSSPAVAAGLLNVSDTDLRFEGDVDGDGTVDVIHYTLVDDGSGNCPCKLTRSQTVKGATTEVASMEVENVVNSSSSSPKPLAGTTPGAGGTEVSNDTMYAAYKSPAIFQALDVNGAATTDLAAARTVRVTLNVLAPYTDLDTRARAAVSMSINARVGNTL